MFDLLRIFGSTANVRIFAWIIRFNFASHGQGRSPVWANCHCPSRGLSRCPTYGRVSSWRTLDMGFFAASKARRQICSGTNGKLVNDELRKSDIRNTKTTLRSFQLLERALRADDLWPLNFQNFIEWDRTYFSRLDGVFG